MSATRHRVAHPPARSRQSAAQVWLSAALSFNGRMRDELLNESLFLDLDQARQIVTSWVADHNTRRPHSSLGYRTPAAYADHLTATRHRAALHRWLRALSGCSHRANGRINSRGSNRHWMKLQWQVTHSRQWVGLTSIRFFDPAFIQPPAMRRQGKTSAWCSSLSTTASSRSRSNGALDMGCHINAL